MLTFPVTRVDHVRLMQKRLWQFNALFSFVLCSSLSTAASPAETEEGKRAFSVGVTLLQDPEAPNYEDAILQFRKAYQLLGSWKVLGNVGLCAMSLERDGEAIEAYEKYLAQGGASMDPQERAQVERDLNILKAQVVRVHLELPDAGISFSSERLTSSGRKVVTRYTAEKVTLDVGMHPGHHTVTLAQVESNPWVVDLAPGTAVSHTFERRPSTTVSNPLPLATPAATSEQPAQITSRPVPVSVFVAGGATVALAAGAAVTGVLALSKRSDYQTANGVPGHSHDELDSLRSSAASLATVSTVLGLSTLAGAGITTYLFLTRPEATRAAFHAPLLSPWVAAHSLGLSYGGSL